MTGIGLADGTVLAAPVVVNVAGPHSGAVNGLAGVEDGFRVRTRPLRQEVHEVRAPEGYGRDGAGPLVADLDLGTYFRGTPSGGIIVGGTEPECDVLQWLDDPDAYSVHPSKAVYDAQLLRAARRLPTLTVPGTPRGTAGVYDVSDDWIPIYDKTDLPGYYVAIGTSGNQFKNAPVVGRYIAAIVAACEDGRDHDTDPVQVDLPHTGHRVDLSHYSRIAYRQPRQQLQRDGLSARRAESGPTGEKAAPPTRGCAGGAGEPVRPGVGRELGSTVPLPPVGQRMRGGRPLIFAASPATSRSWPSGARTA